MDVNGGSTSGGKKKKLKEKGKVIAIPVHEISSSTPICVTTKSAVATGKGLSAAKSGKISTSLLEAARKDAKDDINDIFSAEPKKTASLEDHKDAALEGPNRAKVPFLNPSICMKRMQRKAAEGDDFFDSRGAKKSKTPVVLCYDLIYVELVVIGRTDFADLECVYLH